MKVATVTARRMDPMRRMTQINWKMLIYSFFI